MPAKLKDNKGITFQWIDWNTRGTACVTVENGVWHLIGSQAEADGPGRSFVDGTVTGIGTGYFLLDGTVKITDTPRSRPALREDQGVALREHAEAPVLAPARIRMVRLPDRLGRRVILIGRRRPVMRRGHVRLGE